MSYFFDPSNWEWFTKTSNLTYLLEGFFINLQVAILAMIFSLIVGLALALGSLSKNPILKGITRIWVDIWRNLPLLYIMLGLAIALPNILPGNIFTAWEDIAPGFLPSAYQEGRIVAGLMALVLYNSAVMGEIMRAGIVSLERGQGEAAAALGLTYWKSMRLIILPQGLRRMVPATVSQLITLNKDTTLLFIIGIREAVRHGKTITNANPFTPEFVKGPPLQVFFVIGVLFVIVNLLLSRLAARLEIKQQKETGTKIEGVTGLEEQVAPVAL